MPEANDQKLYPTVTVVVLNYNSQVHLRDNLDSLTQLDYPPDRVELLLADNASDDGSPDWVAAHYPNVRITRNDSNLGFAAGNNMGAQAARGEWVVFLNPDTRVAPNWLSELIRPTRCDPEIICVASKMLSWEGAKIDFADAAINFMGWGCQPGYGSSRINEFNQTKDLLFACGGALLIKRQEFLRAGGFDPAFYAYYEDVDLGWRLWLMGHRVVFAPHAVVYHRHHGSWNAVSDIKRWVLSERNTLFTIIKNYDDQNLAQVLPAALLLVMQRAYLDIQPSLKAQGVSRVGPIAAAYGLRYYFGQVRQLLQRRAYRQLWRRAWDTAWQRLHAPRISTVRSNVLLADGRCEVPTIVFSRLMAGRDVQLAWPQLQGTRDAVQSLRTRSDQQIFPLFQWALTSNFGDAQFIQAMQQVIARFGLEQVFATAGPSRSIGPELISYSREVSQMLLHVMDRILTVSEVPIEQLRLGGPSPELVSRVPRAGMVALAEINRLLWSLPVAPFADVLKWLADGCHKILDSLESAHD